MFLKEKLVEQPFIDLLLELNQDTQNKYFNCQEECNTLTEESIFQHYVKATFK